MVPENEPVNIEKIARNLIDYLYSKTKKAELNAAIEHLGNLDKEVLAQIFLKQDTQDNSILILAYVYHPEIAAVLLNFFFKLDLKQQMAILMSINNNGADIFMLASFHLPETVPSLIDLIKQLPEKEALSTIETILMRVDTNGQRSSLMCACMQSKQILPHLELLKKLKPAQQTAIATRQSKMGFAPTHLRINYFGDTIDNGINELFNIAIEGKFLFELLIQPTKSGFDKAPSHCTALQMAVHLDKVEGLNSILAAMKKNREPADNYRIFESLDANGRHAIMNALSKINILKTILAALEEGLLGEEPIKELLLKQDKHGDNAIRIALKQPSPEALLQLIHFITTHFKEPSNITALLKDTVKETYQKIITNAYTPYDTEKLNQVLQLIKSTPQALLVEISASNTLSLIRKQVNYTALSSEKRRLFLQIQIEISLSDLKAQIEKSSPTDNKNKALHLYKTFTKQLSTLFDHSNDSNLNEQLKGIEDTITQSQALLVDLRVSNIFIYILKAVMEFLFSYEFEDLRAIRALDKIVKEYAPLKPSVEHGVFKAPPDSPQETQPGLGFPGKEI